MSQSRKKFWRGRKCVKGRFESESKQVYPFSPECTDRSIRKSYLLSHEKQ